jgi:hypothetical protein
MRILCAVVLPSTALMAALDSEIAGGGAIRPQVVRDQPIGNEAVFLEKFAHQFQCGMLVSLGLDQHVEDLALGIDGSPQIDHATIDFQIDFIQMLGGVGLGAASAQVCCDDRPEMVHPASDRLIRDRDSTFREQIFDIAEAQCEPEIEPDRLLNNLRREPVSDSDNSKPNDRSA